MKLYKIFALVVSFIMIVSCTPSKRLGTIQFEPKKSQNYITDELRELFKNNNNPSIVVRSSDATYLLSEQESYLSHRIFGAIEKELLEHGLTVRDRGLFSTVISKSTEDSYDGLSRATNTDLILELTGMNLEVNYNTNKYTNKKGRVVKVKRNIKMYGMQFKFRLVSIKDNSISGHYEFNIAPCMSGCKYYIDEFGRLFKGVFGQEKVEPYEFVEVDDLELYMSVSTSSLIRELKR